MANDRVRLMKDGESDLSDDLLGRKDAVETLLHALRGLPPPGCIAVYGSWGTGKTTLLRQAQRRCEAGPTVWFDPWEHERRDDVLSPLLHAIATSTLGNERTDKKRVKHLLMGLAKTIVSLTLKAGTGYLFGGAAGESFKAFEGLKDLDPADFEKNFEGWKEYHDEIKAAKKSFKELTDLALADHPAESRLVVFLDDLDRCLPDSVVALIEGVKLLLCGDTGCRALFVFALDRQIVGEAIRHRFPGSTLYTGESYLEKIFDLSLEVPPASLERVRDFLKSRCADNPGLARSIEECLGSPHERGIDLASSVLSEPMFSNPRVLTRVLNRLALLLADEERRKTIRDGRYYPRLLLTWLAGSERFQAFRNLFFTATEWELRQLYSAILGVRGDDVASTPSIDALVAMPGFRRYFERLSLSDDPSMAKMDRMPGAAGGVPSLWDVDNLLRQAGL